MGRQRKDFWEFVDRSSGEGACWIWKGRRGRRGYGLYSPAVGTHVSAHRHAWVLTNGTIPNGMLACHRCDNPSCVNPAHVFIGTAKDNTQDMMRKGRNVHSESSTGCRAIRRSRKGLPAGRKLGKGEAHPSHKLLEDDVIAIRSFAGFLRKSSIANIYGISKATVSSIVKRKYWAHVA